jgi:hypothetical protein
MIADDLDDRIRSLVRDAVTAAPPPPDLPDRSKRSGSSGGVRGWIWAGVAVAATIAAVTVVRLNSHGPVSESSQPSPSTTVAEGIDEWPAGVSVLVSNDDGITRISSDNGQAVTSRVLGGVAVERAFEVEDGSIVYQTADGDVRILGRGSDEPLGTSVTLYDADLRNGELRLVMRSMPFNDIVGPGTLTAWFQPNEPRSTQLAGGYAYGRFSIVDDRSVISVATDDTGRRQAYGFSLDDNDRQPAPLVGQAYLLIGDGDGTYAALGSDGRVDLTGVRSGRIITLDNPGTIRNMDLRGEWLALEDSRGASLVSVVTGHVYTETAVQGTVTLSRKVPPSVLPTATTSPATEDQAAESPIDGLVIRYPVSSNSDYGMAAEIRGVLVRDGQCLYVEETGIGERFPILWPAGTTWEESTQSVMPPSGPPIPVGANVRGSGGYLKVSEVERLASPEASVAAGSCVDNQHGEIAVVNNQNSAIAADPS